MGVNEAAVARLEWTPRKCDCRMIWETHASFDDPNLVSRAELVPVMALAERPGLAGLVRECVSVGGPCGVNADLKIGCLVAGMTAGADSIDDMDGLRHSAMAELFGGIRALSTLGSFALRSSPPVLLLPLPAGDRAWRRSPRTEPRSRGKTDLRRRSAAMVDRLGRRPPVARTPACSRSGGPHRRCGP
jgi:hypothetical protein